MESAKLSRALFLDWTVITSTQPYNDEPIKMFIDGFPWSKFTSYLSRHRRSHFVLEISRAVSDFFSIFSRWIVKIQNCRKAVSSEMTSCARWRRNRHRLSASWDSNVKSSKRRIVKFRLPRNRGEWDNCGPSTPSRFLSRKGHQPRTRPLQTRPSSTVGEWTARQSSLNEQKKCRKCEARC